MVNKHGWIKIVEAFVAILLVVGVLLVVINKQSDGEDVSDRVYNAEISIIREIQISDSLRDDIMIKAQAGLPLEWESSGFPANVKNLITTRTPNYLECIAKICNTTDSCYLTSYSEKDTYAQAGIITGTQDIYEPVQLKLFCWMK